MKKPSNYLAATNIINSKIGKKPSYSSLGTVNLVLIR